MKDGDVDGTGEQHKSGDRRQGITELGEGWDDPGRLGTLNLPDRCECFSVACML